MFSTLASGAQHRGGVCKLHILHVLHFKEPWKFAFFAWYQLWGNVLFFAFSSAYFNLPFFFRVIAWEICSSTKSCNHLVSGRPPSGGWVTGFFQSGWLVLTRTPGGGSANHESDLTLKALEKDFWPFFSRLSSISKKKITTDWFFWGKSRSDPPRGW